MIEKSEGIFLAEAVTCPEGTAVVFLLSILLCFLIALTTWMQTESAFSHIPGEPWGPALSCTSDAVQDVIIVTQQA